jgi:hypothetical protein
MEPADRSTTPIHAEYEITFDEFFEAYALTQRSSFKQQYLLWSAVLVVGIGLCLLAYFRDADRLMGFLFSFLAISVMLILRPMFRARLQHVYRRSTVFSEHTMAEFSLEGGRWRNPVAESLIRWEGFSHWNETHRSFLLYRGPDVPVIVPKRAFTSDSNLDSFRTLITNNIGRTSADQVRAFPIHVVKPQ